MAHTVDQLFATFAERSGQILHERFGMDASVLLRVQGERLTIGGLVRSAQEGVPEWFWYRATPERLQWGGPEAMAGAFVREYLRARDASR